MSSSSAMEQRLVQKGQPKPSTQSLQDNEVFTARIAQFKKLRTIASPVGYTSWKFDFERTHVLSENNDFQKAFDFDLVVTNEIAPVRVLFGQSPPGYLTPNNQSSRSSSTSLKHGFHLLCRLSSFHPSEREKAISRETKERGEIMRAYAH